MTYSFNALDTMKDLLCPGATCRVLGHSVTTRPQVIKGWVGDRLRQLQRHSNTAHLSVDVWYYALASRTT
jgi:hypothetical protein